MSAILEAGNKSKEYSMVIDNILYVLGHNRAAIQGLYDEYGISDEPTPESLIYYAGRYGKQFVKDLYSVSKITVNYSGPLSDEEVQQWEEDYNNYYNNGGSGVLGGSNSISDLTRYIYAGLDVLGFAFSIFNKNKQPENPYVESKTNNTPLYILIGVAVIFIIVVLLKT
ncbi:hypothetical protein [Saccharicrinis sp. FJH54]|uniref:hypothetical protein n=1 Tax=Saccharicrinis sp. FJH54 TaxID=3344665 RepID=UPI0035D48C3F